MRNSLEHVFCYYFPQHREIKMMPWIESLPPFIFQRSPTNHGGWWVIKTRVYNISGMGHSFLKGFHTKTKTMNIEQKNKN